MTMETMRPPISPATQELVDLCTAVKGGDASRLPVLVSKAQARKVDLGNAWEAFAKGVEAQTEEFVAQRKPIIDGVESNFLAYSQALDKIAAYEAEKKPELLDQAVEMLLGSSAGLFLSQAAYEQSIIMAGPSRFPSVNLFENLFKRMGKGELPPERWVAACQGHRQFYQGAIAEIDASPSAQEPGVPERRAACTNILGVIDRLEKLTVEEGERALQSCLNELSEANSALDAAVQRWNDYTFAERPTPSKEANRVINTALWVKGGKMPVGVLQGLAFEMQENVRKGLADLKAASRLPAESSVVLEEAPRLLEAMESMDEALETLKTVTGPSPQLDAALSQLEAAVGRVASSNQVLKQHNESFGKTMCPNCQTYNMATARTCEKCQRALPRFEGSDVYASWADRSSFQVLEGDLPSGSGGPVVTHSMKALADACEAYEKGDMTQEDFLAQIESQMEAVRTAEAGLAELELPEIPEEATEEERIKSEEFLRMGSDALGLLAQGVAECQDGLLKLEKYAHEDSTADMRDGLRDFFSGCQKLLQIEEVAKMFVAALPPKVEDAEEPAPPKATEKAEESSSEDPPTSRPDDLGTA